MAKATQLVTSERPIWNGAKAPQLLAVRAGVSIGDALNEASDTLEAVRDIVDQAASDSEGAILWGGLALLDVAKGLVDAALEAVGRHEKEVRHD
ncbi:DUF3077 domain-containing protein [Paraburkholderia caballeronis]|uniref:DUF3077 domain-containing protein n=1 Tax=Paraburkholderia caballeronis TaxID=416943 RepID=UPI0010649935|nr:DUF3077 domain-containing protein [Paraburkholderia caballeronis]TDV16283.1 hypothetical protein C7406_108144 [Paraburkholderia caballeronis]TDV20633.1 hypothetical protein C7408_101144 [Paraburkholderia caballeronis]TDV33101.1 hypothetical protein C7404_101240 [Paraburkholderia caballeronis]